jgi:pyruvate,orthophosphate dikinase
MTSHAAVVARGMGKCCISGCGSIQFDASTRTLTFPDGSTLKENDIITLDGTTGEVLLGNVKRIQAGADKDFQQILKWADSFRTLKIFTNADTPVDALNALQLGAEGIGLCRTEHMFFKPDRILQMRKMILAETKEERHAALEILETFQKEDMKDLFKIMYQKPVTIRLLDPPLHEFLPHLKEDIITLAHTLGLEYDAVSTRIHDLHEVNPMLGFRGCRLSVQFPEITEMQIRAIMLAAIELYRETGVHGKPIEIMVPLVSTKRELDFILPNIEKVVNGIFTEYDTYVPYLIGTMMEVPRACIRADSFAKEVAFMSFGTNDLTQMVFGFSRDDIGHFLPSYIENKVLNNDPFAVLDQRGVGQFIKIAVNNARKVNPQLKMGICGEHGGDPRSIKFFNKVGLNYVSCSPFRVPIARVAAAQAVIEENFEKEAK